VIGFGANPLRPGTLVFLSTSMVLAMLAALKALGHSYG
jgi:hypothetical protein